LSAPKRKPVPTSSSIPEQPLAELNDEDNKEARSPQPPPLPQRRRRGASQQQEDDDLEQNMLVVAAPDDSQPGTPAAEEKLNDEAWAEAVAKGELATQPGSKKEPLTQDMPRAVPEVASGSEESLSDSIHEFPQSSTPDVKGAKESPLVALPAAAVGLDDDDDFSGWLEDDTLGEDEHITNVLPAATAGEMK
jgi:hypothetical protein